MEFVSEIEATPLQCCFEQVSITDEKHCVVDVVFLAELPERYFG